jgi:hypothetical protein
VTWALHVNHTIQSCGVDVSAEKIYVCFSTMFPSTIDTYILEIQPKHTTFRVIATTNVTARKLETCIHGQTFLRCVHQGGTIMSCCGFMATADSIFNLVILFKSKYHITLYMTSHIFPFHVTQCWYEWDLQCAILMYIACESDVLHGRTGIYVLCQLQWLFWQNCCKQLCMVYVRSQINPHVCVWWPTVTKNHWVLGLIFCSDETFRIVTI